MLVPIKNVPLPSAVVARVGGGRRRKYPFETLDVGEMFFVPDRVKNNITTYASAVGKKLGRKFATRLMHMRPTGKDDSPWEVCAADDPLACLGIGVWRQK